jgi:hypothetical protein
MNCKCGAPDTLVINSRASGRSVRRRRKCRECGERFSTVEQCRKFEPGRPKKRSTKNKSTKRNFLADQWPSHGSVQEYQCDRCGLESFVNLKPAESVRTVIAKITFDHAKFSDRCFSLFLSLK